MIDNNIMKIYNNCYIRFDKTSSFDLKTNILSLDNNVFEDTDREQLLDGLKNNIITSRKELLSKEKCITLLNILPSMGCEGNCLYCYNEDTNHQETYFLTIENIQKVLNDLHKQNIKTDIQMVRFYGGEPFLNKNLDQLILYLNNLYDITFYISSGLLFSDSYFLNTVVPICKKLLENNIKFFIGVTLDFGSNPYTRQNKHNLTSQDLVKRCRLLEKLGVNVKYSNIISKYTNVDIMWEEIIKHYNESIYMQDTHLRYHLTTVNHPTMYPNEKQILSIYKKIKHMYKKDKQYLSLFSMRNSIDGSFQIYQIDSKKYMFVFPNMYCGIYTNMIAINAKGEIINCQMEPEELYNKPNEYDLKLLLNNEKCLSCNFFPICRSGCIKRIQYTKNEEAQNITCYWTKINHILSLYNMYYRYDGFDKTFINKFNQNQIQNFVF